MSIGSRIKELREERDITRSEFANLIGVTVGAVSNYENEVSSPKEPILFKIIEVLGCDANYLFQDAIRMSPVINDVSMKEYNLIKQYRELDSHGRDMVNTVLEKEHKRWEAENSNIIPMAARNDHEHEEGQQELMQQDLDEL